MKALSDEVVQEWTEIDYWQVLRHATSVVRDDCGVTEYIQNEYEPPVKAKFVGWGRGRAMLFLALNKNVLVKIIEVSILRNR